MVEVTKLPDFNDLSVGNRAETGPMQFGTDWPGVFIRGDDALNFATIVGVVAENLSREDWIRKSVMTGLAKLLLSCSVGNTGWPPNQGGGNVAESQGDQKKIEELPPADGSKAV